VSLMSHDDFVASRLRALIVDLEAPASNEAPLALSEDGKQQAQKQEAQPHGPEQQPHERELLLALQHQPQQEKMKKQHEEQQPRLEGLMQQQEEQQGRRQEGNGSQEQPGAKVLHMQQEQERQQAQPRDGEWLQAWQPGEQGQQKGGKALKARSEAKAEAKAEDVEGTAGAAGAAMNEDQQAVVRSVLRMRDYALVLGMPGTGKTSTIVRAISALLCAGRTVLLTAYTHSAVDNIALKLATAGIEFVRIPGSTSRQ
ncbi:hypothetical protein DUNSADRAFT_8461, partial [Dunaliella salina]